MGYFFTNTLDITTSSLSLDYINPKNKQRFELIYDLHLQGWSKKKIRDYLNSKNLKTHRTRKQYNTKLMWMTILLKMFGFLLIK